VKEDYIILILGSEATPPEDWLAVIPMEVRRLIRIRRYAMRMISRLEEDPTFPSGRPDMETKRLIVPIYVQELKELERSVTPVTPLVAVDCALANLQLHVAMLDDNLPQWRSEDMIGCYKSAITVIRTIEGFPAISQWLDIFSVYLMIACVRPLLGTDLTTDLHTFTDYAHQAVFFSHGELLPSFLGQLYNVLVHRNCLPASRRTLCPSRRHGWSWIVCPTDSSATWHIESAFQSPRKINTRQYALRSVLSVQSIEGEQPI
jgi:hypothetical protein